jgi:hypothetical protein
MTDKIAEAVSSDTDKAINALYNNIKSSVERLEKYDAALKKRLEANTKKYSQSLDNLFRVDNFRHYVYFGGMVSNIITVLLLLYVVFWG